ncbi:Aste57867_1299 [Aphanomyces stellatus]|uniref:Aste57867_1299 protein n=1 Tax=Aphanomyces stellatus TaxID=120398 RepID=A0A485KAB0_9STRA|nr:hypothetical protein As57867_001298 [Aphanomyces stellatus]VFT78518.1 Aste57867_1299 [Aphanomyces stellatus]
MVLTRFVMVMVIFVTTALAQTCSIQRDIDFPGNDVSTTNQDDPSNCCADCQNTPGCKAYNWDSGVCYLKSKNSKPVASPGAVSGVLSRSPATTIPTTFTPPTCVVQRDVDFEGFDIATTTQVDAGKCCSDCQNTLGCKAYNWDNGECYLKSKQGRVTVSLGSVSGLLVVDNPSVCSLAHGVTYNGFDIGSTNQGEPGNCCADCQAAPQCQFYTWYKGVCSLKSKRGRVSDLVGAVSGSIPAQPTNTPPQTPTPAPTPAPTVAPTHAPTSSPTAVPTTAPIPLLTPSPTLSPTTAPISSPTTAPIRIPTRAPTPPSTTTAPTHSPTTAPTPSPIRAPTPSPSHAASCNPVDGLIYQGIDLDFTATENAHDCCGRCQNTVACQTFTFYNGTCFLKSSGGNVSTLEGAVSGYTSTATRPRVSPSTCSIEFGMHYDGFEIAKYDIYMPADNDTDSEPLDLRISMGHCCQKCQADNKCKLFTYVNRVCTLRSDFGARSRYPGAVTGTVPSDRFVTVTTDGTLCLAANLEWTQCDGSTAQQWQHLRGLYLRNSNVGNYCLDHDLKYSDCYQPYATLNVHLKHVTFEDRTKRDVVLTREYATLRVTYFLRPTLDKQGITLVDIPHPNPIPKTPLQIPIGTKSSGLCLAVNASDVVVARSCDSDSPQQKWSWNNMQGMSFLCTMPYTGRCIDARENMIGIFPLTWTGPIPPNAPLVLSTQKNSTLILQATKNCLTIAAPVRDNQRIVSVPCDPTDVSQTVDLSHTESFAWPFNIWVNVMPIFG